MKSAMLALEETESSGNRGISSPLIKASHFKLARLEVSPSVSLEVIFSAMVLGILGTLIE